MGGRSSFPNRPAALALVAALLAGSLASGGAMAGQRAVPGDPAAKVALALRYEHAEGVPRDYDRALALYCAASRQGDADAAFSIGWMFFNGRGVAHDDRKAASWFRLAAERGHAHAKRLLARFGGAKGGAPSGCAASEARAQAASRQPPPRIAALVHRMAPDYRLDPLLVLAIIAAESDFDPRAVSPKNAQGLMQLMPETAQRFGVRDTFDPADNIRGGLAYLRWLHGHFAGDLTRILAAYNAGEGAVERHGGIPPYPETQAYVEKVSRLYAAPAARK